LDIMRHIINAHITDVKGYIRALKDIQGVRLSELLNSLMLTLKHQTFPVHSGPYASEKHPVHVENGRFDLLPERHKTRLSASEDDINFHSCVFNRFGYIPPRYAKTLLPSSPDYVPVRNPLVHTFYFCRQGRTSADLLSQHTHFLARQPKGPV